MNKFSGIASKASTKFLLIKVFVKQISQFPEPNDEKVLHSQRWECLIENEQTNTHYKAPFRCSIRLASKRKPFTIDIRDTRSMI